MGDGLVRAERQEGRSSRDEPRTACPVRLGKLLAGASSWRRASLPWSRLPQQRRAAAGSRLIRVDEDAGGPSEDVVRLRAAFDEAAPAPSLLIQLYIPRLILFLSRERERAQDIDCCTMKARNGVGD